MEDKIRYAEEMLFEIIWDLFRVSKKDLIKSGKVRSKKEIIVDATYLISNWLIENKGYSRVEVARFFNMNHASIIIGIRTSNSLYKNKNKKFVEKVNKFNVCLLKHGLPIIKMNTVVHSKKMRKNIKKADLNIVRFLLDNNISTEKIAELFRVNVYQIENCFTEFNKVVNIVINKK